MKMGLQHSLHCVKKYGHNRQIRCFRKVGAIQRPRRANNVRMKQVLVRGRPDRRKQSLNVAFVGAQKGAGQISFCRIDTELIRIDQDLYKIELYDGPGLRPQVLSMCNCTDKLYDKTLARPVAAGHRTGAGGFLGALSSSKLSE